MAGYCCVERDNVERKKPGKKRVKRGLRVGPQVQRIMTWASIVDHMSTGVVSPGFGMC
jgi:hypothetical protein